MNVTTIEMTRDAARQKFEEYRGALRRRADATDKTLMRTYKQLAEGRQVLELAAVMREGGVDHLHRPQLAIARADATHVMYKRRDWLQGRSTVVFMSEPLRQSRRNYFRFDVNVFEGCPEDCRQTFEVAGRQSFSHDHLRQLRAMVPMIPPNLRPAGDLGGYAILWDVKGAWLATPPKDPILLKHIEGSLYAVLAVWDLTELERAVLAGVRNR
jgi:hypothetical protein